MASGSGSVQAGEEVAHILSDDIEIADPADLIEISTEGITEAVVLERSVDVVVAGASQHHQSETPSHDIGRDANASKDQLITTGSEDIPPRAETPRRIRTPRTRRTSSISRKMNTRAQSLYEATVEAAKDMTSAEPMVSTCRQPPQTYRPACGSNDTILPDQIHSETDEDIAAAVQTPPVTRIRQTLSQPQDNKNSREPSSNYIAEDMKKPGNGNRRTRGQTQRYQEVEMRKRRRGDDSEQIAQDTGETTIVGETPCQTAAAVPERKGRLTRKRLQCQEVKQESAVELIRDLKEMARGEPSTKRRRAPRRCQVPSTDSDDLPTSTPAMAVETPTKLAGRKRKSRRSHEPGDHIQSTHGSFECGKCAMTSKTKHDFLVHAAMHHGGLARKSGESQEFTEDEIQAAIRLSFMRSSTVSCYKCVSKKFTTQIGLNYHLSTCGKTKEELEVKHGCTSSNWFLVLIFFFSFRPQRRLAQ